MQKNESIERAILQNDIIFLREAIGNICYIYRDFSNDEFDAMVEYVCGKGVELMDNELIGGLISNGKTTYTDDDFTRAIFELKKNFCQERIDDVKKIGKILYKRTEEIQPQTPSTSELNKDSFWERMVDGGRDGFNEAKKIGKNFYSQITGKNPNAPSHQTSKKAKLKRAGLVALGLAIVSVAITLVILFKK